MRFSFISLCCLLLVPGCQSAATAFPQEITLEGAIIELRDSIKTQVQDDFATSNGNTMASIQDTLLHVTAALEQLGDEEASTVSIQRAIAKLHSVIGGDVGLDNTHWRHRQLVSPHKSIANGVLSKDTSANGLRGAAEDDSSEEAMSQIAIIKKSFKDAVAKVHYALEDDEKSDYLGRRMLQIGRGQNMMEMGENMEMGESHAAIAEKALENVIDGLLNGGDEATRTAVLDVISVMLALPVSSLQESVVFMIDYTSHQMSCLRSEESTSRMQMVLFVDYLMRLRNGQA